mmetsp:Transcript_26058/g.57068  ORF Transcript_26058/g.57068 Transcript_26058/m.57068 type:complete len:255 (-) Transcript_26058:673-1437(-)
MPLSSTPAKASAIGLADLGSLQAVLRGCKSTPGFWFLRSGDKASAKGSATARQFKGRESSSGSISSDTSSGTCRTRVPISSEMLSTAPSQASESSFSKDLMAITSLCMLKRVVNGSESRLRSFFPPKRTGRVIRKRLRAAVRFWSLSAEVSLSASRDSTGTAALWDRRAKSSPLASKSSFTVAAWLFEVLSVSPSPLGSGEAVPAVLPAPPSTSMGDCEAPLMATFEALAAWRISGPSGRIRTRDFLASKSHSS